MTAPTVYNYNQTTGLYLGSSQANQSPLDTPGTWLYPAIMYADRPANLQAPVRAAYFSAKLGSVGCSR